MSSKYGQLAWHIVLTPAEVSVFSDVLEQLKNGALTLDVYLSAKEAEMLDNFADSMQDAADLHGFELSEVHKSLYAKIKDMTAVSKKYPDR